MPETLALAGTGDQPRDVRDHELDVAGFRHAEIGDQGREGVIGDLGPGGGHGGDERRLARVGEADQADVRHRLQLEGELALLPRLTLERETRRLAARRRQRGVPQAAAAAGRGDEARPGAHQVGDDVAVVGENHGPVRNLDYLIFSCGPVAVRTFALLAVSRLAHRAAMEVEQRRGACVHLEDHAAAPAAVAAVRAAERLELLPVDRCAAVPAVAGPHPQDGVISELRHDRSPLHAKGGPVARPAWSRSLSPTRPSRPGLGRGRRSPRGDRGSG